MSDYTWRERAMLSEQAEGIAILAEALGYSYSDEYGWIVGDHTMITLAMEVRRRGVKPDAWGT